MDCQKRSFLNGELRFIFLGMMSCLRGVKRLTSCEMSQIDEEIAFDSVEEAIVEVAAGRPVIVTDDEDRENEGDLIIAAAKVTPESVNMMIQHARGLICTPCTAHHLQRLGITQMVDENRESHKTDFTVSVDAAEGITTGISAYDRFRTIQLLGNPDTRPDEMVQPGHIFPLKAKDGGVLERAGHTEAAIDLASLAGLFPCAAICEILNDDGTMARVPELHTFKKKFGLKMISIAALIEYRIKRDKLVSLVREMPFETEFGSFTLKIFRSKLDQSEHYALAAGELDASPALVRVHAENLFTDLFRKVGKQSSDPLHAAMSKISEEGTGAVVFISRPDRGFSQLDEIKSATASTGLRDYGIGAQILLDLGIKDFVLLSDSEQNVIGIEGYGLNIVSHQRFDEAIDIKIVNKKG